MDLDFKFSNLIGSVYKNGNLVFSQDGYTVYSPVGNKISIFDLRNNLSRTLCVESAYNIVSLELSPEGTHLIAANETGFIYYINLSTETVIFQFRNGRKIKSMKFSPNAKYLAVCRDNDLQIFELSKYSSDSFYPFYIRSTHHLGNDILTTVDWADDGRIIVCGGEDKNVRVIATRKFRNFQLHGLGSHKGSIVTTQFFENSYDLITVDSRGYCQYWKCSLIAEDLIEGDYEKPTENSDESHRIYFEKTKSFSVIESAGSSGSSISLTAANFHKKSNIMVSAFSNGVFVLHELPSFSLIHNLRVSDMSIHTARFNCTGDWIALGCGKGSSAQLIVWEWQSETYVMKQQAHSQRITTVKFSPDGSLLATGAEDGKVKIWNSRNAFCMVTFDEHTSSVTAVCWTQNGKAILSASLDGTIRAHDLKRYRNFRTLVCPDPTQLEHLVVDNRGDIVCAVGKEVYNIFVWNLENGRLLDILSGHQSNISSISLHGNKLTSVSWDRTLRIWNLVDSSHETLQLAQEAENVSFSSCGQLIAVLTIDSIVSFYRTDDLTPVGTIEAQNDLDSGRSENDSITKDNSQKNKTFKTLSFSPDNSLLLLGGESNYVCLYSVPDRVLLKKFTITQNQSFDGVVRDIKRKNFSEFGNMKLIDTSDSEEENNHKRQINLPGSKHLDLGERRGKPELNVFDIGFCPTGRRFGVCSTEGVAIYSLDIAAMFDPFQLDTQTSPAYVKHLLSLGQYAQSIMGALKLNDTILIRKVAESTPIDSIQLVVEFLTIPYVEKYLKWVTNDTYVWKSPHVHFYMIWIQKILNIHGMKLKGSADATILTGLQQIIHHHTQLIASTAEKNHFSLKYLIQTSKMKSH